MPEKNPNPSEAERYEDLIEQLEEIVEGIESGEVGLEESLAAYERGARLIAKARAILHRAEQRIESLDLEALRKRAEEEV